MMDQVSQPVCSVCIANYNGVGLLQACIESVLEQDCGFALEIIVHDDASTDGSVAWIRQNFPAVVLIESAENAGFCIANNRMAKAATGEYLLLLNNDAELLPNALRALHGAATSLKQPAILGLPQYDAASHALIDRGSVFDPFLNPIPNLDLARQDVGMVIGACLWIPRALWEDLNGFPEWFGSMAEDMYLCCLARLRGCPVRILPDSGFRHWVGHSFGGHAAGDFRQAPCAFRAQQMFCDGNDLSSAAVPVAISPAPAAAAAGGRPAGNFETRCQLVERDLSCHVPGLVAGTGTAVDNASSDSVRAASAQDAILPRIHAHTAQAAHAAAARIAARVLNARRRYLMNRSSATLPQLRA